MWLQREISLRARPRGFHLVTREVVDALPELGDLRVGLCHLFLRHTSASLTLNENASPDVRRDFATWFDDAVPEEFAGWTHTLEGPDVYLCEHRDNGGPRSVLATLYGE